jgi:carbon monoxide dehydrogenase subunit G
MAILIENDFEVPAPVDAVWDYVLDVERIAPCMPGAQLTEVVDQENFKGKLTFKLGPVSLSFAGTVTVVERDEQEHRVELKASGMEQRGKGSATALITAWVEPAGDGATKVRFRQDITISGAAAQFSRGMMQDVSGKLTKQFADCLKTNITAEEEHRAEEATPRVPTALPEAASAAGTAGAEISNAASTASRPATEPRPAPRQPLATAEPIGGIGLGLWAFWRAVVRFFRRLFGREPDEPLTPGQVAGVLGAALALAGLAWRASRRRRRDGG